MIKAFKRVARKLSESLFLNADFKNNAEFTKKYTVISLQRGRLFKWVTFFVSVYSLYLDLLLKSDSTIDALYRQTLIATRIATLVLSLAFIIVYTILKQSRRYRFSRAAKAVILSDMFLSLLVAAVLSLNSQRFTGNIDVYILVVFAVALVIPMYPKWVLGMYGFIHVGFLIAVSSLYHSSAVSLKLFNATTIVLVALVLFFVLYKYNVRNFINEEMLQEDKANFIKLFERNPFPLLISNFESGKIRYANQRAMQFYEMRPEHLGALNHKDLYANGMDADIICKMLETDGIVNDYVVEQKTLEGTLKSLIANYELIDYFGEQAILIGVADIAEIRRMEHELTIHASMDILTGTLNRRVGMDIVRKRYETAKRENGGFVLCFIDIDNLKPVNDRFGHLEGDSLILDVCGIIKEEIKPADVFFRYGGDEFIILFGGNDEADIDRTCQRIGRRFDALNQSGDKPYPIGASLGLFAYRPEMNLELEQIIERVDRNMYTNKLAKK